MHLERIQMLGLVIWRHYLVLFGWCCSPPTPNLPSPPPTHSHDQSRSSTKHLIEIHSVTSDNRELYLYEILKKSTQSTRRKKRTRQKSIRKKNGDSSRKRKLFKQPPSPLTILSMCILVLRYSYLLPITNFHRIKFKIYFGEEDGIPGFSRKFKRFDWMKKSIHVHVRVYTALQRHDSDFFQFQN